MCAFHGTVLLTAAVALAVREKHASLQVLKHRQLRRLLVECAPCTSTQLRVYAVSGGGAGAAQGTQVLVHWCSVGPSMQSEPGCAHKKVHAYAVHVRGIQLRMQGAPGIARGQLLLCA